MKCPKCASEDMTMVVQVLVQAPASLHHKLPKKAMRRSDVSFQGVLWETASFVCKECSFVVDNYGNHVTDLKRANKQLHQENIKLQEKVDQLVKSIATGVKYENS